VDPLDHDPQRSERGRRAGDVSEGAGDGLHGEIGWDASG
jgi:hypothetical protein